MTSAPGETIGIVLHTQAGMFEGSLHVPLGATILEHLNRAPEHLRLSEARFNGEPQDVPFLAVRRDAVLCATAQRREDHQRLVARAGDGQNVAVAGVLPGCRFQGNLTLSAGQRVTDFFGSAPAFIAVRDCTLLRSHPGHPDLAVEAGIALIQASAIVAFSDTLS